MTHSILDFIPAVLTGVPDSDTALAAVPGKQQLLEGKAPDAITQSFIGGWNAIIASCLIIPPILYLLPQIKPFVDPATPYMISALFISMILTADNIISAFKAATVSGILGTFVTTLSAGTSSILLPLLTGLFGIPVLITTLQHDSTIPSQKHPPSFTFYPTYGGLIGTSCGLMAGFLPGIGPTSVISSFDAIIQRNDTFMQGLGAMNTMDSIMSLTMLYTVGNPRSGAAVGIQHLTQLTESLYIHAFITAILSALLALLIGYTLLHPLIILYSKINQKYLSIAIIIGIISLVYWRSGIIGIGILSLSSAIGIYTASLAVRRSALMACLFVPTLYLVIV